jgi:hypothetical protein
MADDGVADQLYQLTVQINRLVKVLGGGGSSPFSDPGTSKAKASDAIFGRNKHNKQQDDEKNKKDTFFESHARRSGLGKSIHHLHKTVSTMHGGFDGILGSVKSLSYGLGTLGIAVTAVTGLFEGAMKLSESYNKLSDVGQMFGGSMLTMAAQAGQAGLSLSEFTALQTRHSVLTASMNDIISESSTAQSLQTEALKQSSDQFARGGQTIEMMSAAAEDTNRSLDAVTQQGAANVKQSVIATKTQTTSLGQLQLAVRENLSQFGFYGMTLTEVTNATADYMEAMRAGGGLKTDSAKQAKAVEEFIGEATEMSLAFGKSREAIMKTATAAMQNTNYAASMIGQSEEIRQAGSKWITFFSGLPGAAGDKLASMFAEQTGVGGYTSTAFGLSLIHTGMGSLNAVLQQASEQAKKGLAPTAATQAKLLSQTFNQLMANKDRLESLSKIPEYRSDALEQLDLLVQLQTKYTKVVNGQTVFDEAKYEEEKKQAAIQKKHQDDLTKSMSVFTSAWQTLTGSFMEGFYNSIASMIGDNGSAEFTKTMDSLKIAFTSLGKTIGMVVGALFSPESIYIATKLFSVFDSLVTVLSDIGKAFGLLWHALGNIVGWIETAATKIQGWVGIKNEKTSAQKLKDEYENLSSGEAVLKQDAQSGDASKASDAKTKLNRLDELRKSGGVTDSNKTFDADKAAKKEADDEKSKRSNEIDDEYKNLKKQENDLKEKAKKNDPAAKQQLERLNYLQTTGGAKPDDSPDKSIGDTVVRKEDEAKADSWTKHIESALEIGGLVTGGLLLRRNVVNRAAANAAADKVGWANRLAPFIPGASKRVKGKLAAAEQAAASVVNTGMDGCCENLTSGLSNLGEIFEKHGGRAHVNAKNLEKGIAEAAETTAETIAEHSGNAAKAAEEAAAAAGKAAPSAVNAAEKIAGKAAPSAVNAAEKIAGKAAPSAVNAAEKIAGKGVLGALSTGAKGLLTAGKFIGKLAPGVGVGLSAVQAYNRFKEGDKFGGAAEVAAGMASIIPVFGTAIGLAINGALIARDVVGHGDSSPSTASTSPTDPSTALVSTTPTGPTDPDNPGVNASPAALMQGKLDIMNRELATKLAIDQQSGDVNAQKADQDQLEMLKVIAGHLSKQTATMKEYNDVNELFQKNSLLQLGS